MNRETEEQRSKRDIMIEIQEILLDERTISIKVKELAERISTDYAGKDLLIVSVLKGAAVFTSDLIRGITIPVTFDFIWASSYGMTTESSRKIVIKKDLDSDIKNKHVLLADMIIDSGETLSFLFTEFARRNPASLKAAVLLDKRSRRTVDVPLAYVGYVIPDKFVVGYGVDCGELYRNLPYIATITARK